MQDKIEEFDIRAPKFTLHALIFLTLFWAGGLIAASVFYFALGWEDKIGYYSIAGVCAFFLACCGPLYYIYFKEKFVFKNEVYTYVKPFKRAQSASVTDIASVKIKHGTMLAKVFFIGKYGNVLINFIDDGTAFLSGEFLNSLVQRNIPVENF